MKLSLKFLFCAKGLEKAGGNFLAFWNSDFLFERLKQFFPACQAEVGVLDERLLDFRV